MKEKDLTIYNIPTTVYLTQQRIAEIEIDVRIFRHHPARVVSRLQVLSGLSRRTCLIWAEYLINVHWPETGFPTKHVQLTNGRLPQDK